MATVDWPSSRAFVPVSMRLSVATPRSAWAAFLTGQRQSVSHAADRLRMTLELPWLKAADAALREAFVLSLARSGDWVRLRHFARPIPLGTMRGSPTITSNASAGATSIAVTTTAGATLLGGDVIGVGSQLIQVAAAGCTANGGGAMTVPLVMPLRAALTASAAVLWDKPTGTFQLDAQQPELEYYPGALQRVMALTFTEVF